MSERPEGDDSTRTRMPTSPPRFGATPGDAGPSRYRLLERLGVGGMGEVFRAEDSVLGRVVAFKLIREDFADAEHLSERFLREAKTAANLRCDHIVPVFDSGTYHGRLFLTMPLLRGETLEDRLEREGRLQSNDVARIGLQAARGLQTAHEAGVVHRDVKPSNIFLEEPRTKVVLLDFGIAKSADEDPLTRTGDAVGTYRFMSPEQLRGRADLDHRSDLFSLGAVLYQAAVGRHPFNGDTLFDVMHAIREQDPEPPKLLKRSLPSGLSDLIMRLLAKDPAERPRSAGEVEREIRAIARNPSQRTASQERVARAPVADSTDEATAVDPTPKPAKRRRRRRSAPPPAPKRRLAPRIILGLILLTVAVAIFDLASGLLKFPWPTGEPGDTTEEAKPITLDASGSATLTEEIDTPGEVDSHRFEATVDGVMTVRQRAVGGSPLDSLLSAHDADQNELVRNDNDVEGGRDSRLTLWVRRGQTYHIQAAGRSEEPGAATGRYELTLAMAGEPGDTQDDATGFALDASGAALLTGRIDPPGDVDFYRFVAAVDGTVTVRQRSPTENSLDSHLYVYDADGSELAQDDDGGGNLGSLVHFRVERGRPYFLKAAAHTSESTGDYELDVGSAADPGDTIDEAAALTLDATGAAVVAGEIDAATDGDFYRFTAVTDGIMTVRQRATEGSPLDSLLHAYDHAGVELARSDDDAGGRDSRVTLWVRQGRTYHIRAAAYGENSTGAYELSLEASGEPGGETGLATGVGLDQPGAASVAGEIETAGDEDYYRFTAPADGVMTVFQRASAGSSLDSLLYAYDAEGTELAQDDDGGGEKDSQVSFRVEGGAIYHLKAAGYSGTSTGGYQLEMSLGIATEAGDSIAAAATVTLDASGSALVTGEIETAEDVDWYRFEATVDGTVTVRQRSSAGSSLDSHLYAYDADENELASDDDGGDGLDSLVEFRVERGRTYYLQASASASASEEENRSGAYTLELSTEPGENPRP